MRFVDGEEIGRVLSFPVLVAALEASHARPKMEIHDNLMGSEDALYFIRSAVDRGQAFGSKLVTSFPGNLTAAPADGRGLPAVHAVYVLMDGADGRPLAVLDGTALTSWKTAACRCWPAWRCRCPRRRPTTAPPRPRGRWTRCTARSPAGTRCP